MPTHRETRVLPYTPEQVYDLVADIARYPEFLPWVRATRVTSNDGHLLVADMVIGFKMVRERFTSRVRLDRPHTLRVDYVSGPLKRLTNEWRFTPDGRGCRVDFAVDFEFSSRTFERLAGAFFGEAFRRMVAAFEARAAALYAPTPLPGIRSSKAQITA